MSFSQITVTTAQIILDANVAAKNRLIVNHGDTLYVGTDSSVTVDNGFPIYANEELQINDYLGVLYAVSSGTSVISVVEHQ